MVVKPSQGRQEGAALILVVVVIAALLAIAAPFVLSMRMHEKSGRQFRAELESKQLANAGRNAAMAKLMESHPDEERRARISAGDSASDTEGVDGLDELQAAEEPPPLSGIAPVDTGAAGGTMLEVDVTDVRAKLDLNTCGPNAIANLLGVTVSTRALGFDDLKVLHVEDTSQFFSDGNPETFDGILRIGVHEYHYQHTTPTSFQGLRPVNFTRMNRPKEDDVRRNFHPEGSLVQDARGFKVALDPMWRLVGTRDEGKLGRFENPAAIRRIADWEFATERAAWFLFGTGLNLSRLRSLGIGKKEIFAAGLRVEDFDRSDPDRSQETREQATLRRKAEKALGRWGISVKYVRQRAGDEGVIRMFQLLDGMESAQRSKMVALYKDRISKRQSATKQLDAWQKAELKRQFSYLSEARDEAPHIETIGRIELESKIRPYVTVDALPAGAAWSNPQLVNHALLFDPDRQVATARIQDARRFGRYRIARFKPLPRPDGLVLPTEYRFVIRVQQNSRVMVFPQLDADYLSGKVEISCRQPRPINVNTASRDVLRAVLTGLQSRQGQRARAAGGAAPNIVTPNQARAVADAIAGADTPLRNIADLRNLLLGLRQSSAIDDHDVDAILRNALDPADHRMSRGTVPFCFNTGDVYEVVSTGIVNDAAGTEIARHVSSEVVRVAPPRDLVWNIDSQAHMTDRWYLNGQRRRGFRDSANFIFLPGRWKNLMQTRPIPLGPYSATPFLVPSASHQAGQGDIQPLLARLPDYPQGRSTAGNVAYGRLHAERYDMLVDGSPIGSARLGTNQLGARHYTYDDASTQLALGPGSVRGWFRLDRLPTGGEKGFVFDGGQTDSVNRVSLYLQDGELVLALHDEAVDQIETGGIPRAQEIRYRPNPPFTQGNWYHIAAFWKGTEPGDMALAVDGRFVGNPPTIGTHLASDIDGTQSTLTVDDASGFPPRGFLRIGPARRVRNATQTGDRGLAGTDRDSLAICEVLEYTALNGNTFTLKDGLVLPIDAALSRAPQAKPRGLPRIPNVNVPTPPTPTIAANQRIRRPARGSGIPYRLDYRFVDSGGVTQNGVTFPRLGFPHTAGTLVMPYGYHCRVKNQVDPNGSFQDTIREGNASLQQSLPPYTPTTILYNLQNPWPPAGIPGPPPVLAAATANQIPVLWAGAYPDQPTAVTDQRPQPTPPAPPLAAPPTNVVGGFPPRGIVRICSINPLGNPRETLELVYYDAIQKIGDQYWLMGCQRGIGGTTPTDHYALGTVMLESIELTDDPAGQYPPRAAIDQPRAYVSLTQPDPRAGQPPGSTITEWLSVMFVSGPDRARMRNRYFMYIPTRDSYELPEIVGTRVYSRGFVMDSRIANYVRQIVQQSGGVRPGDPGDWILDLPSFSTDPNFMHPLKEVIKRTDHNRSRVNKGSLRPLTPPADPPPAPWPTTVPPQTDASQGHRGVAQAGGANATKVVPTFTIRLAEGAHQVKTGQWIDSSNNVHHIIERVGPEPGYGDIVTVTDDAGGDPAREEMRVVHAGRSYSPETDQQEIQRGNVGDRSSGWLVSFEDFVSRAYAGADHARIAKWPVGNVNVVPSLVFGAARPPSGPNDVVNDAPGTLAASVDDLLSLQLEEEVLTGLPALLGPGDTTAEPVAGVNVNQFARGRLFLTDTGEVMAVTNAQTGTGGANLTLLRGALGTTPGNVGPGTAPWRLNWPPHAIGAGGFGGARQQIVPVRHHNDNKNGTWREGVDGGYLALDRGAGRPFAGVLPYRERRRRSGTHFFQRPVNRQDRGSYQTAFGAPPFQPSDGALYIDLPFRAHDRYASRVESHQGVFFEAAKELPGALILGVEWDEHLWTPFNEVKVAVRLDGAPAWDALPNRLAGKPGRLYLFDDPTQDNAIMVRANRVEIRVYVTFKPQAFERDAWKRAALVGGLRLKYRQPTQTLRREERTQ